MKDKDIFCDETKELYQINKNLTTNELQVKFKIGKLRADQLIKEIED